jgi:hypothetical protein
MSFLKKIAKGAGKFLSTAGKVSGSILKPIGKVTGAVDRATGGLLGAAVFSNPLGVKLKAGYELGKIGSKTASGLGKALEGGKVKDIVKAGKEAQQSFGRGREILQNVRRETAGSAPLDIGQPIGGLGGLSG